MNIPVNNPQNEPQIRIGERRDGNLVLHINPRGYRNNNLPRYRLGDIPPNLPTTYPRYDN